MLMCIVIIIIIVLVILIAGAIYYNYYGRNYNYYGGADYYKNKGKFFNLFQKKGNQIKGKFSNGIIDNSQDVPYQFMPNNVQKRAELARNINKLQGNVDKEMFGYFFPEDGGVDLNMPDKHCTGFGENAKCDEFYKYILKDGNKPQGSTSGKIEAAEQEMFMADMLSNGETGMDPLLGISGGDYLPKGDYNSYVESLVADDRLRDNHRKWVSEMLPWSGVAKKVDTLDIGDYVNFVGLRRPQAVVQDAAALLKTEVSASDLINNKPFRFNDSRPIEV